MAENLSFLVAPLLFALFGLPAGFAPGVRHQSAAVRFVLMFMTGTVIFVVWETMLSTIGVEWTPFSVALPLGVASVIGALLVSRRGTTRTEQRVGSGWDVLGTVIGLGAGVHMILLALTARSTSIDFFYFWGVKAIEFAEFGGIDASYLGSRAAVHAHAPYPPLVPLVMAWGIDVAGYLPWRAGLVSMAMWLLLAYPIVVKGLRSRLPVGEATIASGVWLVGMSLALTRANSAGNAEPALVFFATIAIVALTAPEQVFPRWVAPLALCGVVLTKSEGVIIWVLLVAGVLLRDLAGKRGFVEPLRELSGIIVSPAVALGAWFAFLLRYGLPFGDAARETIGQVSLAKLVPAVVESVRWMDAGSGWFTWVVAAVVIALSWRSWRTVIPALAVVVGVLGFLLAYYLHYQGDALGKWVSWTLPRVSLTALSAALLAAAVASAGRAGREGSASNADAGADPEGS